MTISPNNAVQPSWRWLWNPRHCLSFGLGCGLSPVAPGTVGTLFGVALYFLLSQFSIGIYLTVLVLLILLGFISATYTNRLLGRHDHNAIVIDEIAGILVACIYLPDALIWLIFAFMLFRAFDILKPWPIDLIDRHVDGGIGVMSDDLLAGIYTLVCIQATAYIIGVH